MSRPRQPLGPNPPGRLPATMLRALAAGLSDPGRFGRAKTYARDGAVVDIDVRPGTAQAVVQGSRYEPYVVTIMVAPAEDGESLFGLIPEPDELVATCSCPDDGAYAGAFCKHALAGLLTLADEVTVDPAVLGRWRSGDAGERPARTSGRSRDEEDERPDVLARALTAPAAIPELAALASRLPVALAPGRDAHDDDVARALADALSVLRAG